MENPTVSFVVPCYKLAHLLPDCVNSILTQSYSDLEVLIMNDCSPDNTEEVASSFQDPRVRHIRNDQNLGHLRNFNKGIALARGKYIWLISADDCLRRPYVLERYLEQLEKNPAVGFACCSGVGLKHGRETGLLRYSVYSDYADRDRIIPGHDFLKKLLKGNFVLAASGLVRRQCYDRLGANPLDLPYAADWYLWCLFALHYDVAYFAEPMVCYREHDLNITTTLMAKSVESCFEEDVVVPWIIKQKADAAGFRNVSRDSLRGLGYIYGHSIASGRYGNKMTWEQLESSLDRYTSIEEEKTFVRSQVCAAMADEYYSMEDIWNARKYYQACIEYDPWNMMARMKKLFLTLGKPGKIFRKALRSSVHAIGNFGRSVMRRSHSS